ncbi:MAG: peptidoglycan DD-metalloendopeptidase family protein [Acidimicrobiia bacterium]
MDRLRHLLAAALAAALACSATFVGVRPLGAAPPDDGVPGDRAPGGWLRPVDGAVVRPFEEPATRYGPGHRGADLAAPAGTVVRAANDGAVTFAGSVAGSVHVVVAHDGGLRTSYSFLARADVRAGHPVGRGDPLGLTGGAGPEHDRGVLHLGLRVGDRYVDPMLLFGPPDLTELVHLAPTDLPPARPWSPARERQSLRRGLKLLRGDPGVVDRLLDRAVDTGAAVVRGGGAALGAAGRTARGSVGTFAAVGAEVGRGLAHLAAQGWARSPSAALTRDLGAVAERILGWWRSRDGCSTESPPADGNGGSGHLVMAVAGIDSGTGTGGATTTLDAAALGYDPAEVTYYSYAPDGGPYRKEDTWGDLLAAGRRLGEQLRAIDAEQPGREVDLIAHSQGGVVVDVFLQHVYDAADPRYPPIGTVVTLASPHEGAPLATVAGDVRKTRSGRALLDLGDETLPLPPSGVTSTRQLAEGSSLVRDLWDHHLPEHVDFTSIGASDDVVVPATQIDVPGATEVVIDVAGADEHGAIPTDARALQVVRAALEGRAPPCVGVVEGLRGAVAPVVITRAEHTVGATGAGLLP